MQGRIHSDLTRIRLAAAIMGTLFVTFALVSAQPKPPVAPSGAPKAKEKADPKVADLKRAIQKYLAQKSGRTVRGNSVIKGDPAVWVFQTYEAVPKQNPKTLNAWVAEHLLIADNRFLNGKTVEQRRKGLSMVCWVCRCAYRRLKDGPLARQIADAYIMPYLKDADPNPSSYLSKQELLEIAVSAYAAAKDADKFLAGLKMLLDNAPNPNAADRARLRLAIFLDRQGQYMEALAYLKQIDPNEGVGGARVLIPEIEKKLQEQKRKEKRP